MNSEKILMLLENSGRFQISYCSQYSLALQVIGVIFSLFMFYLFNFKVENSMEIGFIRPINIIFTLLLLMFVTGIAYTLPLIKRGSRVLAWGGDNNGLYLGGEFSHKFFYPWNEVKEVILVESLSYAYTSDEPKREGSVALVNMNALKNPLTGNYSKFSGYFDHKKDGTYIVKLEYPKSTQAELAEFLDTYSKGSLRIRKLEKMDYVFDS